MALDLYNKYRPATWSDVAGQKINKEILSKAADNNEMFHSILLVGPHGVGKTTFARIIALSVNCEKGSSSSPCLECPTCLSIINKQNMDIQEIDAASNTGVDDVRELKKFISITSKLRYKVIIIDECHMLSKAAFNALLKTLEEPPSGTIIILATTEFNKVPETIISRCSTFNFTTISTQDILDRLIKISNEEKIDTDIDSLTIIAKNANGGMRDAINLLEKAIILGDGKVDKNIANRVTFSVDSKISNLMIKAFIERSMRVILLITSALEKQNISPKDIFQNFLNSLYSIYVYKITGSKDIFNGIDSGLVDDLVAVSDIFDVNKLANTIEYLSDVSNNLDVNPNPKYFVDITFHRAMEKYYQ